MNVPTVETPKGRLTEAEVRIAGHTSQRLLTLRTMRDNCTGGGTVQNTLGTIQLQYADMQAILSLMIERDENLLIQLDIAIDR